MLGAVPDGAIVLFSGLGADAQAQLNVGVGALAGSTIMLLTIPWGLSIIGGRVNLKNGEAMYSAKPKLTTGGGLGGSGISPGPAVARGGKIMILTSLSYLLIQGSAFAFSCGSKADAEECKANKEKYFALAGLVTAMVFFVGYLYDQVQQSNSEAVEDKINEIRKKAINSSVLSLMGVFAVAGLDTSSTDETHLLGGARDTRNIRSTLRGFFKKYDHDNSNTIDAQELRALLHDLHENPDQEQFEKLMSEMDTDKSGSIDFDEFVSAMAKAVVRSRASGGTLGLSGAPPAAASRAAASHSGSVNHHDQLELGTMPAAEGGAGGPHGEEEEEEDEEEEVPEDLADLSPQQQQFRIKVRSAWMMGLGTALVLLFSDPMVDVLSEFGNRIKVKPFFVAFVLAPLASNASELIAAYNYSLKKTRKTCTISLTSLEGAACMNNSFVLGIFLALLFFKGLKWEFSAETISILLIQLCMLFFAFKKVQTLFHAIAVFSLYPISLAVVIGLEAAGLN